MPNIADSPAASLPLQPTDRLFGERAGQAVQEFQLGDITALAQQGMSPATHTHTAAQISDATAPGRALLTAADAAAQRTALALGNVSNTADADKPVSTAQALAIAAATTADAIADMLEAAPAPDLARIQASVSGDALRRQGGVRRMAGQWTNQALPGYTWRIKLEVPVPATKLRAVRFAIGSNPNNDQVVTAAVATSANYAALNPTGAFQFAGFDGSAYDSFQPYTVPVKNRQSPTEYWSDWLTVNGQTRNDGGTYAVIHVSLYVTAANVMTIGNAVADTPFSTLIQPNLKYQTFFQTGDFTTANQATFSGAAAGVSPVVAVEYLTDDDLRVYSVAHFADSIGQGYSTTIRGRGPVVDACAELTGAATGGVAYSPMCACWAGESADRYTRRFEMALRAGAGKPDIAIIRPYTRNDGGNLNKSYASGMKMIDLCRQYGVVPVLETGIYEGANVAYNTAMATAAQWCRDAGARYGVPVIDTETTINAGNIGTALAADLIHPLDAGQALMVPAFKAAILSAVPLVKRWAR